MDSSIVIKVKYGETLRRFNARIVDEKLALDMNGLREKVLSFFNFPSDAEFTLTYVDEDGDLVTLTDEEDLHDVMKQYLNPLRITVKLNTERSGSSHSRSSANSTPMKSPGVQPPLPNLNASISEILKSVPEVVRESVKSLSSELGSNPPSSPPGYAELLEALKKMSMTYLKEVSSSSAKSRQSGSLTDVPITKDQNNSKVDVTTSVTEFARNEAGKSSLTSFSDLFAKIPADPVDLNAAPGGDSLSVGSSSANPGPTSYDDVSGGVLKKDAVKSSSPADKMKGIENSNKSDPGFTGGKVCDSGNSVRSQFRLDSLNECPFAGVPMGNYSSTMPGHPYAPYLGPLKRSYHHSDGIGNIFHRGVQCDGCGVFPITGPRFKSKVKEDYDLCSICFSNMGNQADYIRIDRPMNFRHPVSLKGFHAPQHRWGPPTLRPTLPHGTLSQVIRNRSKKLDSLFITDVSILDGTIMAPSTPFTKIWRMRNNGNVVWPWGTQLVWIGGDKFSKTLSAEIQIPADGCPVNKESDIAIDFVAPENPGRYISYWRMASPSGQKFGQRVWVLIQVDDSLNYSSSGENDHGFNLNFPPFNGDMLGSRIENVSSEPNNSNVATKLLEPVVDATTSNNKDQDLNFPINDTLLVGEAAISNPALSIESSSRVMYPNVDLSKVEEPVAASEAQTSKIDINNGNDEVEQTLLKALEEMGFLQVDLNKEILRINEYNLEKAIEDLCGIEDWDPVLELEMQGMGFDNKEVNKAVLKKNNGSIVEAIMDLTGIQKK